MRFAVAAQLYNQAAKSWNALTKIEVQNKKDLNFEAFIELKRDLSEDILGFLKKSVLVTNEDYRLAGLTTGEFPIERDPKTDDIIKFVEIDLSHIDVTRA